MRSFWSFAPCGAILCSLVFSAIADAAPRSRPKSEAAEPVPIELFEGMASGDLEVRVIAKDAAGGKVFIKNTTKKPLAIRLPEVFAAVPVAAQFGPNPFGAGLNGGNFANFGNQGMNGQMAGGANQNLGGMFQGQFGQQGNQFGNQFGGNNLFGGRNGGNFLNGGGIFKVEPEKVGKLKITTMCLEHGRPDPSTHIKYELKPLDSYTSNQTTIELVRMLARGEIDQKTAQAAAWNLENGLTWKQLAAKVGVRHLNGTSEPLFTMDHVKRAKQVVEEASRRSQASSDDKSDSLAKVQ